MSRFFDRGAITAAWVGVGMAVTIGVSFLLVIPIEAIYTGIIAPGFPVAWLAGLTIGYYANGRSNRHGGPWGRIIANALLAGAATAVTFALLFLGVKALFFAADNGLSRRVDGRLARLHPGRRLRLPALRRAPARRARRGRDHERRRVHRLLLEPAAQHGAGPRHRDGRRVGGRRRGVPGHQLAKPATSVPGGRAHRLTAAGNSKRPGR